MKNIMLLALIALTVACDKQNSTGTKDHARAQREAERDVENENLSERSKLAEQDLRRRYRFYRGISGDFTGTFKIGNNAYNMRLTFAPTLHVIDTERIRTLEEVQYDLDNLYLNTQMVIWNDGNTMSGAGCVFERVRPDIVSGEVQLIASECPNRIALALTVPGTTKANRRKTARGLADEILSGNTSEIEHLHAEVHSKYNPAGYELTLRRD